LTEFDARARYAVLKDLKSGQTNDSSVHLFGELSSWAAGSEGTPSELNSVPEYAGYGAKANDRLGDKLLRKEVIQPHLPVRLPCSRGSPCRHEAWTISSSWFKPTGASLGVCLQARCVCFQELGV
jgi:hypothetical protein